MFRGPWTHPMAARRRMHLAKSGSLAAAPPTAPPTEADDGAHAAEFAKHPNRNWYTEWWYFNIRDPKTGFAMLCTYAASPYGPTGGSGAALALAFEKGRAPVDALATFSYAQVKTRPDSANVSLGDDYAVEVRSADEYRIVGSDASKAIRWDLTLTRVPGVAGAWLLNNAQGPLQGEVGFWMSWMPFARARGRVTIEGRVYDLEDASAYHDHNWGVWLQPARNWQWLQASSAQQGVSLDLGYADGFDPPRTGVLTVGGRTFDLDASGIDLPTYEDFRYWQSTPWKYPERARTVCTDRTGTCRVEVAWSATSTSLLYTMTALFEQHADVTLRVSEKGADGAWVTTGTYQVDGIAEWSDSYVAEWQTGEGMIGGYVAEATVFGGGISGLTAAHELADRGFLVTVVEPEQALDERGSRAMALGGMARSHYARVPRLGPAPRNLPAGRPTPNARDDRWGSRSVRFTLDSWELPADAATIVEEATREFLGKYVEQGYRLRVVGGANAAENEPHALGARRAAEVVRLLLDKHVALDCIVATQRIDARPSVTIGLDDWVLPGEHGFRCFFQYYRHVTDTMARIPVYDAEGRITDRRVIDRLKPRARGLTLRSGERPSLAPGTPTSPAQVLRMLVKTLNDESYDPRDFLQMGIRMMRYLATCPDRREPLEDMSWWNYLCGFSPATRCYLYRYSDAFSKDAVAAGRVLAAFDWRWGDARTNGSTFAQLTSPVPGSSPLAFDGMLDGPTSEAWFVHWHRYLMDRGVRFVAGTLDELRVEKDADGEEIVVPWVSLGEGPPEPWHGRSREPQYYVCATDAPAAEHASRRLPRVGVPERLHGYTTTYHGEPRDPYTQPGLGKEDRLQTLTGIQYFFDQGFAIGDGSYSLDAPWSLTTVSVQRFWKNIPFVSKDGYAGMLTVDIGDFMTPAGPTQQTAWDSSLERIGEQVWTQLSNDLRMAPLGPSPLRLPRPTWFHLDDNIEFGDRGKWKSVVVRNRSPYLVPIVKDWASRPGPEPFDPNVPDASAPPRDPQRGVWTAPHGGYPVHWRSLVYAGIYLKTFTRMTTMESASESGRHAVNAILDHYNAHHATTVPPQSPAGVAPQDPTAIEADEVVAEYIGDYAGIWNMERYEPSNFDVLKAIDQVLFDAGLPHVFDLLGIEVVPSILSHLFPYRGDCSSWKVTPLEPNPKPAWWCPPFVGEHLGRGLGRMLRRITQR